MDEFQLHNSIQRMGDWGGVVQYGGGDSSMVVMFYMRPVRHPAKSIEEGRPFFENKIFVKIHPPGERLNIIDREVVDTDKRRFPMQWAQFKENLPQVSDGTPIEMLFAANPATAAALQASGVHTVEQCAKLSAHAIETIGMGAQQWVNEAQRYLEVANKGVKASQLKAIVEDKDREINSLKHRLDLVMAELISLRENQNNSVTMADVQQLMAQNGGQGKRAVFAPGKMPANFDIQSAQIAGNHPTREVAKAKNASKRVRARIGS